MRVYSKIKIKNINIKSRLRRKRKIITNSFPVTYSPYLARLLKYIPGKLYLTFKDILWWLDEIYSFFVLVMEFCIYWVYLDLGSGSVVATGLIWMGICKTLVTLVEFGDRFMVLCSFSPISFLLYWFFCFFRWVSKRRRFYQRNMCSFSDLFKLMMEGLAENGKEGSRRIFLKSFSQLLVYRNQ